MDRSSILRASTTDDRSPVGAQPAGLLCVSEAASGYFFKKDVKSSALLMSSKAPLSSAATAMPSL